MNQKAVRIHECIRSLAQRPNEIISGTVVAGSVDEANCTISVQPSDDGEPISGVRLSAVTGSDSGLILFPAEGSDVVIGCVDGPGEWSLLLAAELAKVTCKIGHVHCIIDQEKISLINQDTVFNVLDHAFKMATSAESLGGLLRDLVSYIMALTVATPAGTSSVPINSPSFNSLLTRIGNLLT